MPQFTFFRKKELLAKFEETEAIINIRESALHKLILASKPSVTAKSESKDQIESLKTEIDALRKKRKEIQEQFGNFNDSFDEEEDPYYNFR